MKKDSLYKKALKAINNQYEYASLMDDFYGDNSREYEDQLKRWNAMIEITAEIFEIRNVDVIHDSVWMKQH